MEWFFLAVLLPAAALCALCALVFARLLGWLIALPFQLLGLAIGGVVMLILLPLLLIAGLAVMGTLAALFVGLALPLLMLALFFGGIVWLTVRLVRGATTAR